MKSNKKTIIALACVVIVIAAVITSVVLIKGAKKEEPAPSTTQPKSTTAADPFLLLSSIKHDFRDKEIIGHIKSEDLGIDCNLVFGTSDDCLRLGAGMHKTSSIPGYSTPPIIGGHVQTVFKGFEKAEVGKTITIQMPYGDYVYKISKIDIVHKDDFDFSIIEQPIKQVIFYTCYPFGKVSYVKTQRMFLYCDYVSGPKLFDDVHFTVPDGMQTVTAASNK